MLHEAVAAGFPIVEVYSTQTAYETTPLLHQIEERGTAAYIVDESAAARISDVTTPTGIVAVAPLRMHGIDAVFPVGGVILVLADLNDPANAGTLLRSANAFGCTGVIFGDRGVDPHNSKVVRGSMGAIFRLPIGTATPDQAALAAAAAGVPMLGLTIEGVPLPEAGLQPPVALVVGNERHGLGRWERCCERLISIPMRGPAESLSAAVAGSIAVYQASLAGSCQDSVLREKSQDYRRKKSHGTIRRR